MANDIEREGFRDIALTLIQDVGGEASDRNIEGVTEVLEYFRDLMDERWEKFLYDDTNAALLRNNTNCIDCNRPIQITRYTKKVLVAGNTN